MPNKSVVELVRKTVGRNSWANEQRTAYQHFDPQYNFPDWYLKEIHRMSKKYRPIRWIPLDVPKFTIDMEEFMSIWDQEKIDILRTGIDAAEPWPKEAHPLGKASTWYKPQFQGLDFYSYDKENFDRTKNMEWSAKFYEHPMFAPIIEQIHDTLPFKIVSHLYIWESVREVYPHRDADYFWDMPTMFRIMLNDENPEPTIYVCDVDHGDIHFIDPPEDTNTFAWSNGSQIHGSDFYGKRKQLICIHGVFDVKKYEELLDRSISKYKDKLNYKLEM
jgi:hypothetical protein